VIPGEVPAILIELGLHLPGASVAALALPRATAELRREPQTPPLGASSTMEDSRLVPRLYVQEPAASPSCKGWRPFRGAAFRGAAFPEERTAGSGSEVP
jgi:hypothetical protein